MTGLAGYSKILAEKAPRCWHCGAMLNDVDRYDHPGGWEVDGFDVPQWLYVTCPGCGYQWSLWKLGVPR